VTESLGEVLELIETLVSLASPAPMTSPNVFRGAWRSLIIRMVTWNRREGLDHAAHPPSQRPPDGEPISTTESMEGVREILDPFPPARYQTDEISADPLPSGHTSRRWGVGITRRLDCDRRPRPVAQCTFNRLRWPRRDAIVNVSGQWSQADRKVLGRTRRLSHPLSSGIRRFFNPASRGGRHMGLDRPRRPWLLGQRRFHAALRCLAPTAFKLGLGIPAHPGTDALPSARPLALPCLWPSVPVNAGSLASWYRSAPALTSPFALSWRPATRTPPSRRGPHRKPARRSQPSKTAASDNQARLDDFTRASPRGKLCDSCPYALAWPLTR